MDVECPKCGTVFEFDEAQMRSAVATLKCSVCAHMFRIHTDGVVEEQETQRRWMVRHRATGDVHYFTGFAELHHMIMVGKTTRRDEISRTGERWVELEQMGEFVPVFQAIESIDRLTRGEEAPEVPGLPEPGMVEPERPRSRTIQQFPVKGPRAPTPAPAARPRAPREEPTRPREVPPRPARPSEPESDTLVRRPARPEVRSQESESVVEGQWSLGDMASTTTSMAAYEAPPEPARGRVGALLVLLCVVSCAGGAYAWFFERDAVMGLLEGGAGEPVVMSGAGDDAGPVEDAGGVADAVDSEERPEASRVVVRARDVALAAAKAEFAQAVTAVAARGSGVVTDAVAAGAKKAKRVGERNDVGAMLKSAQRALDRGQKDRAKEGFGRVMELDPGNVAAITGLGWSLLALGRLDSSIAQFKRALHFDSSHGDAYIGLGKAERRRGNLEGALSAYERYLSSYPSGGQASIARHQRDELKRALGK